MTPFRIGHGYDLHRLEPRPPSGGGRPLVLGSLHFEHDRGPISHSDGDALLHALTDAILGALGEPDLGTLFRDDDPRWRDGDSRMFLAEAVSRMRRLGYRIGNLDATIICEKPRVGPRRAELRATLAALLGVDASRVNVKGKSHEQVDSIGEGRAIEVHAVVLLEHDAPPSGRTTGS